MEQKQVLRVIQSLVDLETQGISISSISTEMVPDPDDPDFLDPVVSIKYTREHECTDDEQEHEVRVYADGSMSDF